MPAARVWVAVCRLASDCAISIACAHRSCPLSLTRCTTVSAFISRRARHALVPASPGRRRSHAAEDELCSGPLAGFAATPFLLVHQRRRRSPAGGLLARANQQHQSRRHRSSTAVTAAARSRPAAPSMAGHCLVSALPAQIVHRPSTLSRLARAFASLFTDRDRAERHRRTCLPRQPDRRPWRRGQGRPACQSWWSRPEPGRTWTGSGRWAKLRRCWMPRVSGRAGQ